MSAGRKIARLLLVGDSLIEYGDWANLLPEREVVNRGRSGESVEELRERVGNIVKRQPPPDLVLIMIGTNNVAMQRFEFLLPYRDILATFRSSWPETVPVVNSLLPMELYSLAPETIPRLNDRLRALAVAEKALYLDAWRAMVDPNGLVRPGVLEDEVHLTAWGYQLWGAALAELLVSRETSA